MNRSRPGATPGYDISDPAQIAANRRGEITQEQRSAVGANIAISGCLLPLILVPLLIVGLALGSLLGMRTGTLDTGRVLAIGFFTLIAVVCVRALLPTARTLLAMSFARGDLSGGRMAQIEGRVVWMGKDYTLESAVGRLGMIRTSPSAPLVGLAAGDYSFYYLPRSRLVVAAEPIVASVAAAPAVTHGANQVLDRAPTRAQPDPSALAVSRATERGPTMSSDHAQPGLPALGAASELQSILAEANGFSLADLAANRAGQITSGQADTLRRSARSALLAGLIFLGLGVLAIVLILYQLGDDVILKIVMSLGLFGTLGGLALGKRANLLADAVNGRVIVVEGVASKHMTTRARSYTYQIKARSFSVSQAGFNALPDGRSYRIYYTPSTRKFLSIEPA